MLIIPIGHDAGVRRLPYVTFTLIGLNILVYLITYHLVPAREQRFQEVQEQYDNFFHYVFNIYAMDVKKELGLTDGDMSSALARQQRVENEIRERLDSHSLKDLDKQDYARWEKLKRDLADAKSRLIYQRFGFVPGNFHWYALITSMFMHAGILHLAGNMLFLYLTGCSLEDRWGAIVFGIFYIISGIIAAFSHMIPNTGSLIPCVGASGAIAGLMGAFMIRFHSARIRFFYLYFLWFHPRFGTFSATAKVMLPLWLLVQFMYSFLGSIMMVAVWAHIGGFIFGAVVAFIIHKFGLEMPLKAITDDVGMVTYKESSRLSKAHQLYDTGKTDESIRIYENILKSDPDNFEARVSLYRAYMEMNKPQESIIHAGWLIRYYQKQNQNDDIIVMYTELRHKYPGSYLGAGSEYAIAKSLENVGDYEGAIMLYNEIIKMDPSTDQKNKAIYQKAGVFRDKMGKHQKAIMMYELLKAKDNSGNWKEVLEQDISITRKRMQSQA